MGAAWKRERNYKKQTEEEDTTTKKKKTFEAFLKHFVFLPDPTVSPETIAVQAISTSFQKKKRDTRKEKVHIGEQVYDLSLIILSSYAVCTIESIGYIFMRIERHRKCRKHGYLTAGENILSLLSSLIGLVVLTHIMDRDLQANK